MSQRQGKITDEYSRPVAGATVFVFDTEGGAAVLTSDGSAPLAQPVTTDEFGVYTYHATSAVYREDIYYGGKLRAREVVAVGLDGLYPLDRAGKYFAFDAGGNPIASVAVGGADATLRTDLAAPSGAALVGGNARPVTTRAAMAAITGTTHPVALLQESGREGIFVWNSANLSAQVTADPQQGIYVAPASTPTGASGAWVRRFDGDISIRWFGATGDGVTNDTAAFTAAINYLNSLTYSAVLHLVPGKNYSITGPLPAITKNGKYINGQNARVTHDQGTLFTWGTGVTSSVVDGGIIGLDYAGVAIPTAGTCMVAQEGMNRLLLQNITGDKVNQFLKAGLNGYAGGYFIRNVRLATYNSASTIIDHGDGSNSQIEGLDLTAAGTNRVLDETTATNALATAIKFGSGGWDTAIWKGLLINGYLYGLDINRTSINENVSNFHVENFYFDFCANGMRLLNSETGGGINNMTFSNGWAVGMDGYSVHLAGSVGSHRNIVFRDVHALLAGKCNWRLTSQTMDGVRLFGCVGDFANRLNGTNTGSDRDDFVALFGGWRAHDCRFGRSANGIAASGVPNWQARYGATLPTAAADYTFEGNSCEGVTGAVQGSITGNTITAGKLYSSSVKNNRVPGGATKPEYATTGTVTAPATGVVQTNNTPFHYTLYIYGGTVTSINHNGTQVATTEATLNIAPGDTWSIAHTAAPTIKRVILQ